MLDDPYESPAEDASNPRPGILATKLSWKWVCLVSLFIFGLSLAAELALTKRTYLPPWVSNAMWDRLHLAATTIAWLSFTASSSTGFFWMLEFAKQAIRKPQS